MATQPKKVIMKYKIIKKMFKISNLQLIIIPFRPKSKNKITNGKMFDRYITGTLKLSNSSKILYFSMKTNKIKEVKANGKATS